MKYFGIIKCFNLHDFVVQRNCSMYTKQKNVILTEKQTLEDEIRNLQTYEIMLENARIWIHFRLSMTLIDSKMLNIITAIKSMQFCPICHATPKLFNNISKEN